MKETKSQIAVEKYKIALRKLYGNEICDKSNIYFSGGWCYVNLARRFPDGSIGTLGEADGYKAIALLEMAKVLERRIR